ncbi:MAG: BMC domain-containing protein [Phycisphaerales bacterium]|nr:MAG: BMC domain-containing protein [Phycisphaerales bacterium]
MIEAVGIIELTSIGVGFTVQDAMLKAADVRLVLARTLCSGKYIIAVTGRVAEVTASVDRGLTAAPEGVIDHAVIPRIHPAVFKALGQGVELHVPGAGAGGGDVPKALGVVETYSGTSVLEAADAAVKAGQVTLFRVHPAMALGGKGYMMMAGSVSDMKAAVGAAAQVVRQKGLLVSAVTIPGPSRELFAEYL